MGFFSKVYVLAAFLSWGWVAPLSAFADISFDGKNRFVMSGQRLSVTLVNEEGQAALARIALEWGDGASERELPMVVSKPLLRISPNARTTVEILYQGQGLPLDRESYFLLSVLDVPTKPQVENVMQVALQHHFKLFYRPALKSTHEQAMSALSWELDSAGERLQAVNAAPYYLTLSDIQAYGEGGQDCGKPLDHVMLPPYSATPVRLPDCSVISKLNYAVVSDAGNQRPFRTTLRSGARSGAVPN
ncbi:molecular chaperone [Pseudomonas aeruginosa]|nr:molecular chaperone [Pseudomonas aeruginosa]RPY47101.1 pilus assembly protein [Pseudomonas aeruginosa]WCV98850.1 molecular chaperone [Pseudomonas aeruginosa]